MDIEFQFCRSLLERLQKEFDKEAKHILGGKPETFDDYKYRLGVLEGYQRARKISLDLEREMFGKPPLP